MIIGSGILLGAAALLLLVREVFIPRQDAR